MRILKHGLLITVALLALQVTGYGFQGGGGEDINKVPGVTKAPKKPTKGRPKTRLPLPPRPLPASGPSSRPAALPMAEAVISTGLGDCLIILDGETKGRTNSSGVLKLTSLRPGSHIVTVRRSGYRDENRSIELYGGRSESFAFSLSRVLTVAELLTNAEDAYRKARYGEAISASREALAAQPDNPRANLVLGEAYYMEGKTESDDFLWKAIGLGETATLPIKHHHGGPMRFLTGGITGKFDDLCSGNLILRKGAVEFHSNEKSDEDFNVPIDKIIEVKNESHKNSRLSVKVKARKGNKDSEKTYNFHAPAATVVRLKISEVSCQDLSCGAAVNTLHSLLQKLKQ